MFGALVAAVVAYPLTVGAEPRAVVELFTSQGCSSCPTADRLLGELSKDPTVLALSLPIDYWDYLGWKDTLADARHTARQKGYSHARGDRKIYTPQMIVNGVVQTLGSDRGAIEKAVTQSRGNAAILSVPVEVAVTKDAVTVTAAAGAAGAKPAEVWLCPINKTVNVNIGRGENRGRTVTYTNVVRGWIKLGPWTGARVVFNLPRREINGADAFAVLVQSGTADEPGPVIGATLASLP
jgi:hypothetical protein